MFYKNPNSKRENPFMKIYRSKEYNEVVKNGENPAKFPYLVDIEVTNHCNLKCIFCGQQAMTRTKGFMSEEIYKKIVDECAEHGTPIRLIRWGEPFLHPKIIEFFKYAKSKGLPVHVTNNGQVINEAHMKALVDLQVDSVIFSFQGATEEQYNIMRVGSNYEKLKSNVLKLVEMRGDKEKPFIHVSSTMTNESAEEVKNFVDYWGNIVDFVGVGKTNLSKLSAMQIKSFEVAGKLDLLKKQETIKKTYVPCNEVHKKLSIDWDGKVACCCSDFDNFLIVGDLNESSIEDIWNNSKTLKLFRELLDKNMHKSLTLCSTCYHTYEEF
jgi:radical SAM protein with 4Fe4S-binding SPASM domain